MNPAVSIVDQYCFDVYVGSKNIAGTKKGKLDIAPLNHLPLLPSGPGGFDRSWSYKTYPVQKYNFFLYLDILYIIFYKKNNLLLFNILQIQSIIYAIKYILLSRFISKKISFQIDKNWKMITISALIFWSYICSK